MREPRKMILGAHDPTFASRRDVLPSSSFKSSSLFFTRTSARRYHPAPSAHRPSRIIAASLMSAGSLGFNTMRHPRVTNLPGSVGASIIVSTRRTKPLGSSTAVVRPSNNSRAPTASPLISGGTSSSSILKTKATQRDAATTAPHPHPTLAEPSVHTVFATVVSGLRDAASDVEVAADGARVVLVYPMRAETAEQVSMRLKTVHPVTGQLAYRWVVVYDPSTDQRFLRDFSLLP